jgi:hypothetical protein
MSESGVLSRITTLAAFVAAWVLTFTLAFWAMSRPAFAQAVPNNASPSGDLAPTLEDMDFIYKQIIIAERHVAGEELADILPNVSLPWGLRTVDGKFNNLIPGQENFGRADEMFITNVDRFRPDAQDLTVELEGNPPGTPTSYNSDTIVEDSTPRLISHLIVDNSAGNPAATATAIAEEGEGIGVDIAGLEQYFIPNTAPDEGLSAPYNAFISFFGQFFDHGLDLVNKGGNSAVYMPLQADDPLYCRTVITNGSPVHSRATGETCDPDNNFMVMTRATQSECPADAAGPCFINATTPHVDQQQTYGSHGSAQMILRHYEVVNGVLQNSGELLNGWGPDGMIDTGDDGGMATWDAAQSHISAKWGMDFDDNDGANVPLMAADYYGEFIPGAAGLPQLVISPAQATSLMACDDGSTEAALVAAEIAATEATLDEAQADLDAAVVVAAAAADAAVAAAAAADLVAVADRESADGLRAAVDALAGNPAAATFEPFAAAAEADADASEAAALAANAAAGAAAAAEGVAIAAADAGATEEQRAAALAASAEVTEAQDRFDACPAVDSRLVAMGDGNYLLEGNLGSPVDGSRAIRANHSFFIDVSHSANPGGKLPDVDNVLNPRSDMLSGQVTRGIREDSPEGFYDDELLGVHFICGDGRCNENIALTAIHHIFHSEHNRLVYVTKRQALDAVAARGDVRGLEFLNRWLATAITIEEFNALNWATPGFLVTDASLSNQEEVKTLISGLDLHWDGDRVFQNARFVNEMEYNRIVFDEFGPTLAGLKDPFEGYHTNVDPSITAEFSQSVYRFGHSMLVETVPRYDTDFNAISDAGAVDPATADAQLNLFEAFLNPMAFYNSTADGTPTLSPEVAAGAVIRGLTRTQGNELDEFITGALSNNLVGLPLDLGAINIARGRDVGNPSLNSARKSFHAATGDTRLAPYGSWGDYLDNLRHESSFVNFLAAYGTHPLLAGVDGVVGNADDPHKTYEGRRDAACAIVGALSATFCTETGFISTIGTPDDAIDFLFSLNGWANTVVDQNNSLVGDSQTGVDDIDFWNGGLAEARMPFGGYLGSTHNFVFENQLERLQNGDRMYYLFRVGTLNLLGALESNPFTSVVMRNTDLGEPGAGTLPLSIFTLPNHIIEVDIAQQFNGAQADEAEAAAEALADASDDLAAATAAVLSGDSGPDADLVVARDASLVTAAGAQGAADVAQEGANAAAIQVLVAKGELGRVAANGPALLATGSADADGTFFLEISMQNSTGSVISNLPNQVVCTGSDPLFCVGSGLAPGQIIVISDTQGAAGSLAAIEAAQQNVLAQEALFNVANAAAQAAAAAVVTSSVELAAAERAVLNSTPATVADATAKVVAAEAALAAAGGAVDPSGDSLLTPLIIRDADRLTMNIYVPDAERVVMYTGGDHVTIGGTEGDDTIIGGIGDDSLWGRGGNDRIEGNDGGDLIEGGLGDDIITDLAGSDALFGGEGDDYINSGNEEDFVFGDNGNDFMVNVSEFGELFGGDGNDFMLDGIFLGHSRGGAGNDWIENTGGGEDLFQGDHGAAPEAGEPPTKGHDVMIAWAGNNDMDMENGDDIMVDGPGIDRAEGQLGHDWFSFANDEFGVDIDLDLTVFLRPQTTPSNSTISNRYDRVEGVSGSAHADILRGTANPLGVESGNELVNFDLIAGLDDAVNDNGDVLPNGVGAGLVPASVRRDLDVDPITGEAQFGWTGGELILGGGGSDLLAGEGGNDILDGDASLKVNIRTPDPSMRTGNLGMEVVAARTAALSIIAQSLNDAAAATAAQAALLPAVQAIAAAQAVADSTQAKASISAAASTSATAAAAAARSDADAIMGTALGNSPVSVQMQTIADAFALVAAGSETAAVNAETQANDDQLAYEALRNSLTACQMTVTPADCAVLVSDTALALGQSMLSDMAASLARMEADSDASTLVSLQDDMSQIGSILLADNTAFGVADELATGLEEVAASLILNRDSDLATAVAAAEVLSDTRAASAAAVAEASSTAIQALASAALVPAAEVALAAAEAALAAADGTILVSRMDKVMGAIASGFIRPGELSISRVISDDDADNSDTDGAIFSGNFEDYTIEGDPTVAFNSANPAGNILDFDGDGFISVTDDRALPVGGDGTDLIRNIERLVFGDQTIVIDSNSRGPGSTPNSLAVGAAIVRGIFELGETLSASSEDVTDADNVNTNGAIPGDPAAGATEVAWLWESEAEPGSGVFSTIVRLVGLGPAVAGEPVTVRGDTMVVTGEDIGLQIRVRGIFKDEAGVFEQVVSASNLVSCPAGGCPAGVGAPLIPVATFIPDPLRAPGTCGGLTGLEIFVENASRVGLPRIDFTVLGANLADFQGAESAFPVGFVETAELAVSNMVLTFVNDGTNAINAVAASEIVAVLVDPLDPTLGVLTDTVDISFSIRGAAVVPLVNGPTTATLTAGDCVVATIGLDGNSAVGSALDVTATTLNGEVIAPALLAGEPVANFVGTPANVQAIDGSLITFTNLSRLGAPGRMEVVLPGIPFALFNNTGFGGIVANSILATDAILVDSFTLTFDTLNGVITDIPGEIVAILDPVTGAVDQSRVDLVFEARGADVDALVFGSTIARVTVTTTGTPVSLARFNLFGNSETDPAGVIELVTAGQRAAAAAFDNAGDLAGQTDALEALAAATRLVEAAVNAEAVAAELAVLPSTSTLANRLRITQQIDNITFENLGDPAAAGSARIDFTIPNQPARAFPEFDPNATGVALTAIDELAIDGITLSFMSGTVTTAVFAPEAVAIVNADGTINQNRVTVMWSIRGDSVFQLTREGITTASIFVGTQEVASIQLMGNSMVDEANGDNPVTPLQIGTTTSVFETPAAGLQRTVEDVIAAGFAVDVARLIGAPGGLFTAQLTFDRTLAFADLPVSVGPISGVAQLVSVLPMEVEPTTPVVTAPTTPGTVAPQFPATGTVDRRGRLRIKGSCNPGGQSFAPPLSCRSDANGKFDCRGRALMPGTEISVTCSGGEQAYADLVVGAVGKADKRGQLRINGICEAGVAWSPNLSCETRRAGTFRCSSNGTLNPEEEATVYCR